MNKKVVKEFIKENFIWCFLLAFVIFGLGGAKLYNFIHKKVIDSKPYEHQAINIDYEPKNYEVNQYKVMYKTDYDIAEFYYDKIKKMWINNPGELYDRMTEKAKSLNGTRDEFIKRISKFVTSQTPSSTVAYYKVEGGKVVILTSENMEIVLDTNGVNDYKISLMAQSTR